MAGFFAAHPVLAFLVLLAAVGVAVLVASLVVLAVFECEWRVRSRRERRRRGGQLDLTGVRL